MSINHDHVPGIICYACGDQIDGIDTPADLVASIKGKAIKPGKLPAQYRHASGCMRGRSFGDAEAKDNRTAARSYNAATFGMWATIDNRLTPAGEGAIKIGDETYDWSDILTGSLDAWADSIEDQCIGLIPDRDAPIIDTPPVPPVKVNQTRGPGATVGPKPADKPVTAPPVAPKLPGTPPMASGRPTLPPKGRTGAPGMVASPDKPVSPPAQVGPHAGAPPMTVKPAAPETGKPEASQPTLAKPIVGSQVIPAADYDGLVKLAEYTGAREEVYTVRQLVFPNGRTVIRG